jgi:O-antigen/teichoic acid export membrane protein
MLLMSLLGLSGIIFVPVLLRWADAQLMAAVLVAQVYVYYLVVLVQFGLGWSGPAALARATSPAAVALVWRSSVTAKMWLLGGPAALVFGVGYASFAWGQWYLLWFVVLLTASALNSNWFLQARHNFAAGVSYAALGVGVSTLMLCMGVSWHALDGAWVVLILVMPQVCLGVGSWWRARQTCASAAIGAEPAAEHNRLSVLRKDAPLVASQLLLLASTTLGTVVVGGLATANTTAAYAATEKLFNLAATVLVGLYMALYPRFAAWFYSSRAVYWQKTKHLMLAAFMGGVLLAALLHQAGPWLLAVYLPEPLAQEVVSVLLPFALWLGLCISQHVLTSYLVLAERNRMVLWANAAVLAVTVLVGYALACHNPVAWVYGMVAGQVLALVWLVQLYCKDRKDWVVVA